MLQICNMLHLCSRFLTLLHRGVARGTQPLPIRGVPEQRHVPAMRYLVVDHLSLGGHRDPLRCTFRKDVHVRSRLDAHSPAAIATKRMFQQVASAGLLPTVAIPTLAACHLP